MWFTDTHTHLYLEEFEGDRSEVVRNAIQAGDKAMLLPNIDSGSVAPMLAVCQEFPGNCYPMIGLHPTSMKADYMKELAVVVDLLANHRFYGIGECGLDFYWDKSFVR